MKKIVPFNNVLTFDTDVYEITAISLEHDINTESDSIGGTFHITGEYKPMEGEIRKEPFSFDLPFDIALGCNYKLDTMEVDIDDFRYELVAKNKLKVNIDLYIDGKVVEEPPKEEPPKSDNQERTDENVVPISSEIQEKLDLLDQMLKNENNSEETETVEVTENDNQKNTLFSGFNEEEKYVTYRVYCVLENDNLDKILEKYNISKEELAKYNNIEGIKPGDKLIIPSDDK